MILKHGLRFYTFFLNVTPNKRKSRVFVDFKNVKT